MKRKATEFMKIAVICGGRSNERDVSLSTGAKVATELRKVGHSVVYIDACEGLELDCTPEEAFEKSLPIPVHVVAETAPDVRPFFERKEGFFGKNVIAICKAADVVFMNSEMSAIPKAIAIARAVNNVAWQNVVFALVVKVIIMAAGLFGYASMWAAVFADTGVSVLCVLNACRVLYKRF